MKTNPHFLSLLQLTAVMIIGVALGIPADARKPSGTSSGIPGQSSQLTGDPSELLVKRDKFEAYRQLQFEGDAFYSKNEEDLQNLHRDAYHKIRDEYIGERISMAQARRFLDELIDIGGDALAEANSGESFKTEQSKKAATDDPGDESGNEESDPAATQARLESLIGAVKDAMTDRIDANEFTPEINRIEWLTEELLRHAEDDEVLATASLSSQRRALDRLISSQSKEKGGSDLSDRKREGLMRDAISNWGGLVGDILKS